MCKFVEIYYPNPSIFRRMGSTDWEMPLHHWAMTRKMSTIETKILTKTTNCKSLYVLLLY